MLPVVYRGQLVQFHVQLAGKLCVLEGVMFLFIIPAFDAEMLESVVELHELSELGPLHL